MLIAVLAALLPGDRWASDLAPPPISHASHRTAAEAVAYVRSHPDALFDFSPSNILETLDTAVLDRSADPETIHVTVARTALDALEELYPIGWILVPVEAGHDPRWDPGAEGTEAEHNRAVVARMQQLASRRVLVRPIHNDRLPDDLGLPEHLTKRTVSSVLVRQARAAMLAAEAAAWNADHPDPADRVHVHELSVHFNAGAGGAMVLHQGETVHPERRALSEAYAEGYLALVVPRLNATGALPTRLRRWASSGKHDDVMMYRPAYFTAEETRGITLRYGVLQGRGYMPRYVEIVRAFAP